MYLLPLVLCSFAVTAKSWKSVSVTTAWWLPQFGVLDCGSQSQSRIHFLSKACSMQQPHEFEIAYSAAQSALEHKRSAWRRAHRRQHSNLICPSSLFKFTTYPLVSSLLRVLSEQCRLSAMLHISCSLPIQMMPHWSTEFRKAVAARNTRLNRRRWPGKELFEDAGDAAGDDEIASFSTGTDQVPSPLEAPCTRLLESASSSASRRAIRLEASRASFKSQ